MASLGSNKELEAIASGKSQRTSLLFNLDNKEDFAICSLTNGKIEQQNLDLVLTEGETIAFRVDGPHSIHLSGYYIDEEEFEDGQDGFINDEEDDEVYSDEAEEDSQIEYDSEMDSEEDSEEEDSEEEMKTKNPRIRVLESDEEEDEEDSEIDSEDEDSEDMDSEDMDSEDMDSEEEEIEEPTVSKKAKFEAPISKESPKTKEQVKAATPVATPAKATPAKITPTKATPAAAPVTAAAAPVPAAKPTAPQAAKEQGPAPVKKTLPSGLQIEDLKLGNGAKATSGKKVLIHYKGTLANGQVFDSSFGGKPLKFAVGKSEVIKGMDIGIVGMAVGGTRKLVIPGPLAYGNQALPKIPRNSTLIFEIRLEKIL